MIIKIRNELMNKRGRELVNFFCLIKLSSNNIFELHFLEIRYAEENPTASRSIKRCTQFTIIVCKIYFDWWHMKETKIYIFRAIL